MKINKNLVSRLQRLAKKGNDRKERKSIKEKIYPKIKLFDPRGRVIGHLEQGKSVNYQKLLSKKRR